MFDFYTDKEVKYKFSLMFEDRTINVWSYMLMKTQRSNIDNKTLFDAISYTAGHRKSEEIIKEWRKVIDILKEDEIMKKQWKRYQKENFYAQEIEYNELIKAIEESGIIFDKYSD